MLPAKVSGYLLCIALGLAVVLQGGLNRKIGQSLSLPGAVAINSTILVCFAYASYFVWRRFYATDSTLNLDLTTSGLSWWYLIPGICGFCIVIGFPYAIARIGAVKSTLIIFVAQIIFSFCWDYVAEGLLPSSGKIIGALVATTGVAIIYFFA